MRQFDPFYWLLKKLILRNFFQSYLRDADGQFVMDNIDKHRKVLWITLIVMTGVYFGLQRISEKDISTVILALIAPVTVMGAGWFAVSFGSIPRKLINKLYSV